MEWSKYKNAIILLLVLLNLSLLLLNLEQKQQEIAAQQAVQENAVQVLEKHGIRLAPELVPWQSSRPTLVQNSERYEDRVFAQALIGTITTELGGVTTCFQGAGGQVEFFQAGNFEATMNAAVYLENMEAAQQFLSDAGVETMPVTGYTPTSGEYRFWQTVDDHPVFTCEIVLRCENGQLRQITGRRLQAQLSAGGEQQHTAATLLINLAQAKIEGRISCTEILGIQEGYINQGVIPVWQLETDNGIFYLDCITGEMRIV